MEKLAWMIIIANWITTFSRKWKQFMALKNMKEAEHN